MATATAGVEWSSTKTFVNLTSMAAGAITYTGRCAWASALAPQDIQIQFRGHGDTSATAQVYVYYKWANLTTSASVTALLDAANANMGNWNLAMAFDMNSASTVVQSVSIPVEGRHLAIALENSSSGTVSGVSIIAIARHSKAG